MVSLNNLLSEIADLLELTDTQFNNIKSSYEAVANWLNTGEEIQKYGNVEIFPQGSIGLGTVVKPLRRDEYDVDMVLFIDRTDIPTKELKRIIGNRLKEHSTYKRMLDEEGKRCWTLVYADPLSYHMDILPTKADTQPKYYNGIPSILCKTMHHRRILSFGQREISSKRVRLFAIRLAERVASICASSRLV